MSDHSTPAIVDEWQRAAVDAMAQRLNAPKVGVFTAITNPAERGALATQAAANVGNAAMSMSDMATALDIINQNGGGGDVFDEDEQPEDIERWQFPRYPGADKYGTCAGTKKHKGDKRHEQIKACGDTFVPDPGDMYLSRAGIGYDTDVETVAAWLAAPRNIVGGVLLLGEPGSGKTALIEAVATYMEQTITTHVCTPDDTRDSLFLRFVGEGKGEDGTPYVKGPVPRAVEAGHLLYMDEFLLLVDGVKPVFYELSDGRKFLSGGNVDGSALEVHPDFRLIVSSNPAVRGASLPEPIGSRFASTTITVDTSAAMLTALGISDEIVHVWEGLGAQNLWRPQVREVRLADYWLDTNIEQACSAFLPEHAPMSQRKEIRDYVVSILGAETLREDGRLVVS